MTQPSGVATGPGWAGLAGRCRYRARAQRDNVHCACDQPATVHCVVHCLGHCSWTLLKKIIKKTPEIWGVTKGTKIPLIKEGWTTM